MPRGAVLTNLKELEGVVIGGVNLPPLKLPDVDLGDLDGLDARAKEMIAAAEKVRAWVRSTQGQLDKLAGKSREVRELVAVQMTKAEKELTALLNHELPAYRRAAWLGLLEHEFSRELNAKTEVEELLGRLVEHGRLKESPAGDLKVYGKAYFVAPESWFEAPEVTEARQLLAKLLSRVFQETGKRWGEKALKLKACGVITLDELWASQPGKCAVEVPAEEVPANGNHPGFRRGGGVLLVESNGEDIQLMDVAGSIEAAVLEAMRLKVFLKVASLHWQVPPTIPALSKEMGTKVQLIWHLLKRAHRAKEQEERLARARETLTQQATVTCQEFFLEQKLGACLAEFGGVWENADGSAGPTNLFLLIERREEAGTKRIHIVDVPNHLRAFFAHCRDEYAEEGNKFKGLPYPLVAVLQAIYGQVVKASQDASKTDQITAV